MSLLFGYIGNEPARIQCALHLGREALTIPVSDAQDGWGIGFYQAGEVLLQKRPKAPAGSVDFYRHLTELRSDIVLGHVNEVGAGGPQKPEDADPYRFRSWLFAASVAGLEPITKEILSAIPDFMQRNIRGKSSSEPLFYLFLSFLHASGKLEDPGLGSEAIVSALRKTTTFIDETCARAKATPGPLALMVTNGRLSTALARGRALCLLRVTTIADCQLCAEPPVPGRKHKRISHEHLRAVLLLSAREPLRQAGWESVPDSTIVTVTHDVNVQLAPLAA